jgi:YebC/PmpR family DNA-binding regulatory protein
LKAVKNAAQGSSMSGHSKWSTIKRKKGANDARRGKIFTKIIREITVAAREGGGEPDFNPRLRLAVSHARENGMPQDNVERAIKKGTGEIEGVVYEEVSYEGYGPGGVALYIECLTDNLNRAVADVRHILSKNDGSLGTAGSVAWQFDRKGQIYVSAEKHSEDEVFEAAIEGGADDVSSEGEEHLVTAEIANFQGVQEALTAAGIEFERAELAWIPQNEIKVAGSDAEKLLQLVDALEDSDEVQNVYSNADIDDAVIADAM